MGANMDLSWDGLQQGAEWFGYSDARAFQRVVPRVLGANKGADGVWRSHPLAMAGPVPDVPTRYPLPAKSGQGVDVTALSGAISSVIYMTDIALKRKFPWIELRAELGFSGAIGNVIVAGEKGQG